jgi:hypothetical protein
MEVSAWIHAPGTLTPRKEGPWYPLNKRLTVPKAGQEVVEKRKISCPATHGIPGVQPMTCRYSKLSRPVWKHMQLCRFQMSLFVQMIQPLAIPLNLELSIKGSQHFYFQDHDPDRGIHLVWRSQTFRFCELCSVSHLVVWRDTHLYRFSKLLHYINKRTPNLFLSLLLSVSVLTTLPWYLIGYHHHKKWHIQDNFLWLYC